MLREINITLNGAPFLKRAEIARSFFERSRGLLGRQGLPAGHGLLIAPCSGIHTLGMKFPIDAIFLNGDGEVVRMVQNIRPGRFMVSGGRGARVTLEIAAGWLSETAVRPGDNITWQPV